MSAPFPRHVAIAMLLVLGCAFAGNHVAARVSFDHGTGLLVAVLCRAGLTMLALIALVRWQREPLRLPPGTARWQVLVGLLIATQSLSLYSAVARIPVALALLVSNVFPILLALLTWALGGARPTRRASLLMGMILVGLVLALDVPAQFASAESVSPSWVHGVLFALTAATAFACAVWVTTHRLGALAGSVRSMNTMVIVFSVMALAGASGLVPGGMAWPRDSTGWASLAVLMLLYAAGFSVMFVSMPRLNMARNAPVLNIEPIATLVLGWLVLDQRLTPGQIMGGLVVVAGIVLLSYRKS
jgi:drug/metabolite transporter (DMT)-like permease